MTIVTWNSRLRKASGTTMLIIAFALGAAGAGMLVIANHLTNAERPPERAVMGEVVGTSNCDERSDDCQYTVSYTDASGQLQFASIAGNYGDYEPQAPVKIFYQRAHPGIARFPDTGYPNQEPAVIVGLFGLAMIAAGGR